MKFTKDRQFSVLYKLMDFILEYLLNIWYPEGRPRQEKVKVSLFSILFYSIFQPKFFSDIRTNQNQGEKLVHFCKRNFPILEWYCWNDNGSRRLYATSPHHRLYFRIHDMGTSHASSTWMGCWSWTFARWQIVGSDDATARSRWDIFLHFDSSCQHDHSIY